MSTTPPAWSLLCAMMNVFDALAGMSSHTGIDMDEKQAFQRGVGLRAARVHSATATPMAVVLL